MPTKVSSVENRKEVEQDELSAVTDRRVTNHGTLSGDISDPVKQQDKPYNDHTKKVRTISKYMIYNELLTELYLP